MRTVTTRELGETGRDRVLRFAGHAGSIAVIVLLTLLAALPLGLPPEARHALPLLPLAAIHDSTLRRPGAVPEWLVFLCGLALDVLTQGPLGFWAFVYLFAHALALAVFPLAARGAAWRLALLVLALVASALVAWGLSSLYVGEAAAIRPWLTAVAWALPAALVIVLVSRLVGGGGRRRSNLRLEREGWR